MGTRFRGGLFLGTIVAVSAARAGTLTVLSHTPTRHALTVPIVTPIVVHFDRPVLPSSVNGRRFSALGRWSGAGAGTYTFSNGDQTVTLTPTRPFSAGEMVTVLLSHDLLAADSSPLRSAGYAYQFWTRTCPANLSFVAGTPFTNRVGGIQTRIYGAAATDMNEDGFLDLTTVNEVSADLRVFLNSADGQGNYDFPFHPPAFAIGVESSPNEPSDFNRDGHLDLASAASSSNRVDISFGVGDGTFSSSQVRAVPSAPHGLAVLDANGDGAMEVATSNTGGNNVSLLMNDGSGNFAAAVNFEGGGSGEYGLTAADMNNDGILDLVVGARTSQTVIIQRGNGNGTFTNLGSFNAGGSVWMLVCGDVNGDGHMDVTCANNGASSNGAILLGDGAGGLAAPVTYFGDPNVATDLGDFDGDGDLDWVLSSFSAGHWRLFTNNGVGTFAFVQTFPALNNPSCAVILDFDNDRDLDLALTDEIADVITLQKNDGTRLLGDFANDGDVDLGDYNQFAACFTGPGGNASAACCFGDFNGDGDIDCEDWTGFQAAWTAGGAPPDLAQCITGPVPTVSQWGLLVLALTFMTAGTVVFRRMFRAAAGEA